MHRRYPPDADVEDFFDVDSEEVDGLLQAYDEGGFDGYTEALSDDHGDWSFEKSEDFLEWFGRP